MPAFTRKYLQMFALPDEIIDDLLATHQEDMAASKAPEHSPGGGNTDLSKLDMGSYIAARKKK